MPEDIAKSYRFLRFLGMSARGAYLIQQRFFSSFIFVHINKCGGTSIQRALGIPVKDHDTALERKRKIGRRWDSLYKFSVIRHPYYRVESLDRYRGRCQQIVLAGLPMIERVHAFEPMPQRNHAPHRSRPVNLVRSVSGLSARDFSPEQVNRAAEK